MGDGITHDELVQALVDAMSPACDEDGLLTARELASRLGWSINRVYRALRALHDAGQLESVYVQRPRLDGLPAWKPAYRLKSC